MKLGFNSRLHDVDMQDVVEGDLRTDFVDLIFFSFQHDLKTQIHLSAFIIGRGHIGEIPGWLLKEGTVHLVT